MYRKEKPISLKSSASSLCNNLSVFINTDRGSLNYAVVHKYLVNIVSSSTDGSQVTNRQVVCKEPSATQQGHSMIMQVKWVSLASRTVLVLTSIKGIQMFEYDGSAMLYWHALGDPSDVETGDQSNFGRGIAAVGDSFVCVGTQEGHILVFGVPAKGTNVVIKDVLKVHKCAICDLASEGDNLVSSDEEGNILMWKVGGTSLQQTGKIPGTGDPCSSLALWKGVIVGAFGCSGQIKVYNLSTGKLGACACAHARWINAIDVAKDSGMLLSASEDSYVRVWQLRSGSSPSIEFKYGETVTDLQLVGAKFVHDAGRAFCVTGYDSSDLVFFVQ